VTNWSSGLPFCLSYSNFGGNQDCNHDTGGSNAPCRPNAHGHLGTNLSSPQFHAVSATDTKHGTITKNFWTPQSATGGLFSFPGLDVVGNAGNNNYYGPSFFNTDLSLSKAFVIHESVEAKFRFDAFNAFNHINTGNPNSTDIFNNGPINNEGVATPRYLEFSARVQF
jgi:hypothetical protein